MTAEYSANAIQTVAVGDSVVFTEEPVRPCRGFIYHRDDSGLFRVGNRSTLNRCGCRFDTNYLVTFSANIQVPVGGTVEPIQLSVAVDGETDPSSTMIFTPAAAEQFGNVSTQIVVSVPWICRCSTISIRNTGAQAIEVQNANLVIRG